MFKLDKDEIAKLNIFLEEHNKTCVYYDDGTQVAPRAGAIGGTLTYSFTPTTIGTIVKVECACGGNADLTDYDW